MYPRISRVGDPKPIALDAYETLAGSYAVLASSKPHNAYYERPATLSLLGKIQEGDRALDAGCGPSIYAERLVGKGAEVVAFDASERMVRLAKERLWGKAEIFRAYLENPLASLKDATFDMVVSALMMDYVEDWRTRLLGFFRVLRPGGRLIFSVEHPSSTFVERICNGDGDYFETDLVGME
jgi:SAM-dependent methyltransferase